MLLSHTNICCFCSTDFFLGVFFSIFVVFLPSSLVAGSWKISGSAYKCDYSGSRMLSIVSVQISDTLFSAKAGQRNFIEIDSSASEAIRVSKKTGYSKK